MTDTATRIPNGAVVQHRNGWTGHVTEQSLTFPASDARPTVGGPHELVYWDCLVPEGTGPHDTVPPECYAWVPVDELTVLRVRPADLPFPNGGTLREVIDADFGPCTITVDAARRTPCGLPTVFASYLFTPPQPAKSALPDWMHEVLPPGPYGRVGVFHADGSPGHGVTADLVQGTPKCPECKGFTLKTTQEAYGDRTECHGDGCNYTSWHSIGD